MVDVAVIGCGVVGASVAYELSRYKTDVLVLEAENDVATGTSKANSAILHAGYDPKPGTLMARLNVEGARLAKELCRQLDVPYKACGSLVVAFSQQELRTLEALLEQGRQNGVEGLQLIDRPALREMEPAISEQALAALWAPTAAIVSPWELTIALAETAVRNGAKLRLNHRVISIEKKGFGYAIQTVDAVFEARYIVNAAGIRADEVHNLVAAPAFTIKPERGEYYLLDKSEGGRVRHVVFQCPTNAGKGVLVAPTVHGNLIVGPNSEPVAARDDLSTTAAGLDLVRATAQKSVPSIRFRENIRNFSGLRAATEFDDFIIGEAQDAPGFIDLAGIKSPGLTAAPAIGKMAAGLLQKAGLTMELRPDFINTREHKRFKELPAAERDAAVRDNDAFGRVICRCETVTEGEILDALKEPIPPRSIDGVKRRCGAGMGRCQGGFCGPRVVEILARELKISPLAVQQDLDGSAILDSPTKGDAHV